MPRARTIFFALQAVQRFNVLILQVYGSNEISMWRMLLQFLTNLKIDWSDPSGLGFRTCLSSDFQAPPRLKTSLILKTLKTECRNLVWFGNRGLKA